MPQWKKWEAKENPKLMSRCSPSHGNGNPAAEGNQLPAEQQAKKHGRGANRGQHGSYINEHGGDVFLILHQAEASGPNIPLKDSLAESTAERVASFQST